MLTDHHERERERGRESERERGRERERKKERPTERQTNREIASGPIVSVSLFMVVFWFSEWMVLWMSLAWRSPSRIYWVSSDKLRLRWHSSRTLRTIWWVGPTPRLFRSEFCTTTRNSPTLCLDWLRRKWSYAIHWADWRKRFGDTGRGAPNIRYVTLNHVKGSSQGVSNLKTGSELKLYEESEESAMNYNSEDRNIFKIEYGW